MIFNLCIWLINLIYNLERNLFCLWDLNLELIKIRKLVYRLWNLIGESKLILGLMCKRVSVKCMQNGHLLSLPLFNLTPKLKSIMKLIYLWNGRKWFEMHVRPKFSKSIMETYKQSDLKNAYFVGNARKKLNLWICKNWRITLK